VDNYDIFVAKKTW